jgi:hypothetical protein
MAATGWRAGYRRPVTGWQGNDGGQGGWNQPPYNPQGGPYQPDPYNPGGYEGGPQGTARYPYGPTGDPYGQNPYQTGGFPAQGYGQDPYAPDQYGQHNPYQTGGFPAQDFGPPPPPRRSKLPMILGVLAIVIIVGAVVAIVLVNRDSGEPTAGPTNSSTGKPAPTSPDESSTSAPPSSGGQDGWQTVDNTADSGLTYEVPPDWKPSDDPRPSGLDVDFTGTAEYGTYDCDGATYVRSFATSGDVQSKDGDDLDLAKTVGDFAKAFGTGYFKDTATVGKGTPEETEVGGKKAVKITAPVTPKVTLPKCEAAKGEVAIIGVLLEEDGKPAGVAMLAVVSDVEGGPDDPRPLPADVAQQILDTARAG